MDNGQALQHFLLKIVYMPLLWLPLALRWQPEAAFSAEPVSHVPLNVTFSEHLFTLPPSSSSRDFSHSGNAYGAEALMSTCQSSFTSQQMSKWRFFHCMESCCVTAHDASSICHIKLWVGKATRIWMHLLSVPVSFKLQKKHSKKVSFRPKNLGYTPRWVHKMPQPVCHSLHSKICSKFSKSSTLYPFWFYSQDKGLAGKFTPDCQQGCLAVMWWPSEALKCSNPVICELMNV